MSLPRTPILTSRLLLRPYEPADAPAFFDLLHRHRVHLVASFPDRVAAVRSLTDAEVQLRHFAHDWRAGRFYVWGLWHSTAAAYLGDICLMPQGGQQVEIGYYLAPEAQGQGYAREALAAICQFGFEVVKAKQLLVRCFADNAGGQAVALAVGFRPEQASGRFAWLRNAAGGNGIKRFVRNADFQPASQAGKE